MDIMPALIPELLNATFISNGLFIHIFLEKCLQV